MSANLSRERRRWALSVLKNERERFTSLGPHEQLVYAVMLLAADDDGTFDIPHIEAALSDPLTAQTASMLLSQAGWRAGAAI
ncbi:hypothetical protein [Microbacterium sp. HJ5]